jgi:hypothetical protein
MYLIKDKWKNMDLFIFSYFNSLSNSDYIASNDWTTAKKKKLGRTTKEVGVT